MFNARFFCYAKTIALMDDVLYNYVIKEKGLLTSSLNNVKGLVEDKIIGIEQRAILRNLYLKEKNMTLPIEYLRAADQLFPLFSRKECVYLIYLSSLLGKN